MTEMPPPAYNKVPQMNDGTPYQQSMMALAANNELKVKQQFKLWEAISQGCCEQRNTYKVYTDADEEIMTLREDSDFLNRCCCAPAHTYGIGMLGVGEGKDIIPEDGFAALTDRPRLIEREGCCSKLLCCFSMTDTCANHADILVTGSEEGGNRNMKYTLKEKLCNGCTPEILINAVVNGEETPVAIITGPTFFGGCGEFCCDYDYTISTCNPDGTIQGAPGDIATIEKKKPEGCLAMLTEGCTDVDNFEIHFNPNCKQAGDPEFKALALGALVYLDFMFFEMDNGMCSASQNGGLVLTLFNCYVFGCICPCQITCEKNQNEG